METLRKFIQNYTNSKLTIQGTTIELEKPRWELLQGISIGIIEGLTDVDIDNPIQLAYCNPMELHLKTNVDWKVLLDLMDQSILMSYSGDKIVRLRPLGIRGAVELAVHYERHYIPLSNVNNNIEAQMRYNANMPDIVSSIAKCLEMTEDETKNLMLNIYEDTQVNLIWKIWNSDNNGNEAETE